MRRYRLRELGIWFLFAVFAVAMMSWNPSILNWGGRRADFLLAMQIFAAYFYRPWRSLWVAGFAGLIRDSLFGLVVGPDILSGILIAAIGSKGFSERTEKKWTWIFPQAAALLFISRMFRSLMFYVLPIQGRQRESLGGAVISCLKDCLLSLPGLMLAMAICLLLFYYFLPPFPIHEEELEDFDLSDGDSIVL